MAWHASIAYDTSGTPVVIDVRGATVSLENFEIDGLRGCGEADAHAALFEFIDRVQGKTGFAAQAIQFVHEQFIEFDVVRGDVRLGRGDGRYYVTSYGRTRNGTLVDRAPPGVVTCTVPVFAPAGTTVAISELEITL